MTGHDPFRGSDAGRVVPAYALTRGRTRSAGRELPLESLVTATEMAVRGESGLQMEGRTIVEMSLADWRRQTAINLDGVFLSVKHSLPLMRKTGGGSIIVMSSLAGLRGFRRARETGD